MVPISLSTIFRRDLADFIAMRLSVVRRQLSVASQSELRDAADLCETPFFTRFLPQVWIVPHEIGHVFPRQIRRNGSPLPDLAKLLIFRRSPGGGAYEFVLPEKGRSVSMLLFRFS
jgi:hypothetical protein